MLRETGGRRGRKGLNEGQKAVICRTTYGGEKKKERDDSRVKDVHISPPKPVPKEAGLLERSGGLVVVQTVKGR